MPMAADIDYPWPWLKEDLLRQLLEEGMGPEDIAEEYDRHISSIYKKIGDFGLNDLVYRHRDNPYEVSFFHLNSPEMPYEVWHHCGETVPVHRLVAVAEYGFDEVAGNVVHHRNEVPWANWHSNLVPMTHSDHVKHHVDTKEERPPEGF